MMRRRKDAMASHRYYVYMMTDRHRSTLYTGITNDLQRRVYEHKTKDLKAFTSKYYENHLVYFEETGDVQEAIAREKRIKGWTRTKKIALIESANPRWEDVSRASFDSSPPPDSFAK